MPAAEETINLFSTLQPLFPSSLPSSSFSILFLSSIVSAGLPDHAANLYTHICSQPEHSTPAQRQALVRRLREALVKLVSVIGVPRPLEAIFCIAAVEREEDRDYGFSRENWSSGPENRARGKAWLDRIYKHNHAATENVLAAHRDFEWLSTEITYGLYLSDHSILTPVETELVVLSGIMLQNMPRETGWHLRGMRRIGVSKEDVEGVWKCIEKMAEFARVSVDKVPKVADIEHEVAWEDEETKIEA